MADDFIEPLRPLIDLAVWKWYQEHDAFSGLTKEGKAYLLARFIDKYQINGNHSVLFEGVNKMASSFAKVCKGEQIGISIPSIP